MAVTSDLTGAGKSRKQDAGCRVVTTGWDRLAREGRAGFTAAPAPVQSPWPILHHLHLPGFTVSSQIQQSPDPLGPRDDLPVM